MDVHEEEHGGGNKDKKKKNKSGQIPAFGNWDYENELPITQYFESARQAGLIRVSNSSDSGESCRPSVHCSHALQAQRQLYAVHFHQCNNNYIPPPTNPKVRQAKEYSSMQTQKKEKTVNKADYVTERAPMPRILTNKNNTGGATRVPPGKPKQKATNVTNGRAVDEDLYKIPPELLHSSKRKKKLGIFSRCLVPDCMV